MTPPQYPIPGRLNLFLALLAVIYGLVMNTGYALCHEAEHDIFHPRPAINDLAGTIVTLYFPASFQLRRQGHLGHHLRNRTDDEAFDLYFEGENPVWKYLQFYGILTGFFWLTIVISNFIAVINPRWLALKTGLDRPTAALQETLNPKYFRLIQLEAALVFLLHGTMIWYFKIPVLHYLVVLFGFGFLWSTLQYIHHYGTPRDVQSGAWNVRTWRVFDLIWLNHHWHLNHHLSPTVPWIYLPKIHTDFQADHTRPIPFWKAYFQQWRGPRFTRERLNNRHAGKFVR